MNFKKMIISFLFLLIFISCTMSIKDETLKSVLDKITTTKKSQLVLIHGLASVHKWSDEFLEVCLKYFGSGNVYIIYTNPSIKVEIKTIKDKRVYHCGDPENFAAGKDTIAVQTEYIEKKVKHLKKYGLKTTFNIIAHSMGGLVSRMFIHKNPGTVTSLVTLGTPHYGSPLADDFKWAGIFAGATNAIDNLRPKFISEFNKKYPVDKAIMAKNGKIYTIEGYSNGQNYFGWAGEILLGWQVLKNIHKMDNDGLVPMGYGKIEGAEHLYTFKEFNHYELVRQPEVAYLACKVFK